MRRLATFLFLGLAALIGWAVVRGGPAAPLNLGDPPGVGTGRKLVALHASPARCRALLDRAGVRFDPLPPRRDGPRCGYRDGVRLRARGSRGITLQPAGPALACPVAAAFAMWEWDVVQPAALRWFGRPVATIEHFGSYNCRRVRGDASAWSEHATADALDVAAFRFSDGRLVTVAADWRGDRAASRFLRAVRAGACPLFATVLSPDYNAAHHDHLHLDQASRGGWGWRACR